MTADPASASTPAPADGLPARPRWATKPLGWLVLALVAYVPPLLSSPGNVVADTKQYLYLDPGRLMSRGAYLWDQNIGLGTVTHQVIGYLFPMGPFYGAFDALGVPDWVAQRLWTGTVIFAAGVGILYLFRTLGMRGPGVVAAAFVYMLSPYSMDYVSRISVILLPWAGLGFLIALTDKSLRDGGWRYPAVFALVVQVVGGVNATALVYAGLGPVLWVVWSVLGSREVHWRDGLATTLRIGALTALTSLWWAAGLAMQGRYGLNILEYTETLEAVARTSAPNEVLRGLGYWFFYGTDKLGPWVEAAENYTQNPIRIAAGYGLAAFALASATFTRWRHRAFMVVLLLVGTVVAVGAYPYSDPGPFGALFKAFAEASSAGLALRSTGRATPLVVLAVAMLIGAGVNALTRFLYARGSTYVAFGPAALVIIVAGFNFPALWDGTYYGENLQRDENVPEYWLEAIDELGDRGSDTRIWELPGADFAAYRWGNMVDPITPGLTDRPYVAHELVPWGGPAPASLVKAIDRRIQEGSIEPDGLADLARLLAAGDLVLRYDIQHERFDLVRPRLLSRLVDAAPGLSDPEPYGGVLDEADTQFPRRDERELASPPDEPTRAPVELVAVDQPRAIVRTAPAQGPIVMAGDADGLVAAAEAGLLSENRLILFSATFAGDPAALTEQIERGAVLVVTDSNRQRGERWSTVRDNVGYTEALGEEPMVFDPSDQRLVEFPDEHFDSGTRTVSDQGDDVELVQASAYGTPITYTPEDRPANALDGDVLTAWRTSAFSDAIGERIRITLPEPVTTHEVVLVQPINGPRNRWVTEVELRFDGSDPQRVSLGDESRAPEGQLVAFEPRTFSELEIEITDVNVGRQALHAGMSAVGFAEIRLAGSDGDPILVTETVVMPTYMLDVAADGSGNNTLMYLMNRERLPEVPPRSSPEPRLVRAFEVPTNRVFSLGGTARFAASAPSAVLDDAFGANADPAAGGVRSSASETLPGCVHCRASSAIDGDPSTSWQTPFVGVRHQWIEYEVGEPVTVEHLDLELVADGRHSVPTALRIEADGEVREVAVPPIEAVDGSGENATVTVPLDVEPMTGSTVRVTMLDVRPLQTTEFYSGSLVDMPVGIAELGIAGLSTEPPPQRVDAACREDLLVLDGEVVSVRVVGDRSDAEYGEGLALALCGDAIELSAGEHRIESAFGRDTGVDVDRIVLGSDEHGVAVDLDGGRVTGLSPVPPEPPAVVVEGEGRVGYDLAVGAADEPYWVVLAQSHNDGWSAAAEGTDLGPPTLVDGYANGWLIDPAEMNGESGLAVTLEWVPQRVVWAAVVATIGGLVLCGVLIVAAVRRGRRVGARGDGCARLSRRGPMWGSRASRPGALAWRTAVGAALGSAIVAGIAVKPWAGVFAGVLTVVLARLPRSRTAIAVVPAGLVGVVGLYIAASQWHNEYPSVFEWVTLFPRAPTPTYVALVSLGVIVFVDFLRDLPRWPTRSSRLGEVRARPGEAGEHRNS